MANSNEPWVEYIRETVAKGQISYDKLVTEAAALVPPGRGYRMAVQTVEMHRAANGHVERTFVDEARRKDQRIRYGQRIVAIRSLRSAIQGGRVEVVENGDGQKIVRTGRHPWGSPTPLANKMTPWGAFIVNAVEHGSVRYEDLFERAKGLIPRERAIQTAIHERAQNRTKRGMPPDPAPYSDDHNFRLGARALFGHAVHALIKSNRLTTHGSGKDRVLGRGDNWSPPRY